MVAFCVEISLKKNLKNFVEIKKRRTFASSKRNDNDNALWCNGSTSDSGSACESSNLSKATFLRAEVSASALLFNSHAYVFFFGIFEKKEPYSA